MDMTTDYPLDHNGSLNAPSEVFDRTNENHPTMDGFADHSQGVEEGWEYFPGLLPA
jgi:hypothetical protein